MERIASTALMAALFFLGCIVWVVSLTLPESEVQAMQPTPTPTNTPNALGTIVQDVYGGPVFCGDEDNSSGCTPISSETSTPTNTATATDTPWLQENEQPTQIPTNTPWPSVEATVTASPQHVQPSRSLIRAILFVLFTIFQSVN